jgi:hypothetical protein
MDGKLEHTNFPAIHLYAYQLSIHTSKILYTGTPLVLLRCVETLRLSLPVYRELVGSVIGFAGTSCPASGQVFNEQNGQAPENAVESAGRGTGILLQPRYLVLRAAIVPDDVAKRKSTPWYAGCRGNMSS